MYRHETRPSDSRRPPNMMWQTGTMPMYSPMWTNEKPWLQRLGGQAVMMLDDMGKAILRQLPSSGRSNRPLSASPPNNSSLTFVLMCGLWYTTSALSSNTGKALLNQFRYPITLTFVQFGFVAFYCILFMSPLVRFSKFKPPTKQILKATFPMGLFQVGGHIFSSIAISRIPVSTVHTIKALSPLFTVAAYALLFGVSYSSKTYVSLLPLTLGVMLACSFDMSASNYIGLLCAFGSALVFVSSNIFFKKIMPTESGGMSQPSHKLDKLNLLLYSSGMAFILMIPIWLYYDLPLLLSTDASIAAAHIKPGHTPTHSATYYFFMNGTVHYAQNIIAFVILSSTSPVTYSIASLIKRVAVICIAIVWFAQPVHPVQAFGIILTFTGLYMYNNAKGDVAKGEKKIRRMDAARDFVLPTTKEESRVLLGTDTPPEGVPMQFSSNHASERIDRSRAYSVSGQQRHAYHTTHAHQRPPPSAGVYANNADGKFSVGRISSPVDSYPSPPPSIASPPSETIPLPQQGTYHGHHYQPHGGPYQSQHVPPVGS
ncbi:hypothetical protein D9611_006305 [Ephemerocybe angulata]|uniref:Sugar phosphate transporter domain-containing protein n=1 Tax=Ephemerocybe angulata TaxID=980116 RepID=A0A8H5FGL5_9AGAR|nr:hypothetical protein D9611_006305 [Tulosesus angulatus]